MSLGIVHDASFENCNFSRNFDSRPESPSSTLISAAGFLYFASINFDDYDTSNSISFTNCAFDENRAVNKGAVPGIFCAGMLFGYNFNGLTIKQCTFNSNSGFGGTSGYGTQGCSVNGGSGTVIEECEAMNNYSNFMTQGFALGGFDGLGVIPPQNPVIRSSVASGNTATGVAAVNVAGIFVQYAVGYTIEDCVVANNSVSNPDQFVEGYGIQANATNANMMPFGSTSYGLISRCHVLNNTVDNIADPGNAHAAGILIASPSFDVEVDDCVVANNTGTVSNSGIWLRLITPGDPLSNIIVKNCSIEYQDGGILAEQDQFSIFTKNNLSSVTLGVELLGSTSDIVDHTLITGVNIGIFCSDVNNAIIQHNTITNFYQSGVEMLTTTGTSVNNNFMSYSPGGIGVNDFESPSTNVVSNNRTFNVQTPFFVNYAFGPAPVANGSLTSGFPPANRVYFTGQASQSGQLVTGSGGAAWNAEMAGGKIIYQNGDEALILAYGSATSLLVNTSMFEAAQGYAIVFPSGPSDNVAIFE
jgi:hypothetical protein